jgi:hypothetical protein
MGRTTVCELCRTPSPAPFINSGLFYGSLLGALVGTIVAGPHFLAWSWSEILASIAMCAAGFAVVAFFVIELACGALTEGREAACMFDDTDDTVSDWGSYDD